MLICTQSMQKEHICMESVQDGQMSGYALRHLQPSVFLMISDMPNLVELQDPSRPMFFGARLWFYYPGFKGR